MWFRRSRPNLDDGAVAASSPQGEGTVDAIRSPGLRRVLDRVFRDGKVRVLDLGPSFGESIIEIARRGAQVTVDEFRPPRPVPRADAGGDPPPPPTPVRFDHDDDSFDLVLLWERLDFVPPDRLREFGQEVRRVLKVGGWILALSSSRKEPRRASAGRVRILDDDRIAREPSGEPERNRWAHPNRDLERALDGIAIQGIHLHRDGLREIVGAKGGVSR